MTDSTETPPGAERQDAGPPVTSPLAIIGALYTALAADPKGRFGSGS